MLGYGEKSRHIVVVMMEAKNANSILFSSLVSSIPNEENFMLDWNCHQRKSGIMAFIMKRYEFSVLHEKRKCTIGIVVAIDNCFLKPSTTS